MAEVTTVDLRGQTYDQVDRYVKAWCDLPEGLLWDKHYVRRPLYGTVPRTKTVALEETILLGNQLRNRPAVTDRKAFLKRYPFEHFRSATNLQLLFQTDKAVWCHRHEGQLIFTTGAYEDWNQERNVKLFQKLANVWNDGRVLSIHKGDEHDKASNDGKYPFVRPYAAILVVRLGGEE
jgi:hypothetical protein